MLTEQRFETILTILEEQKSVTVQELKEKLDSSESTIRRDLTALHNAGKLQKVFGGAVALDPGVSAKDPEVSERENLNREEKIRIAKYAASLVGPDDVVYIDAGTTTGYLTDFLKEKTAIYVTNGISHARKLLLSGFTVWFIGGELKRATEATVGEEAAHQLRKVNFTIGFFGVNGVSEERGYTTLDINEASIKRVAMKRCRKRYILCDHTKFNYTSSVNFGEFTDASILTDEVPDIYRDYSNVTKVD